jgi:hypothetical protein
MGKKEDESNTGWISPYFSPFLLGARFESYGPFISLVFIFLGGLR